MKFITACIFSSTGQRLKFISSETGFSSGPKAHSQNDDNGPLAENGKLRMLKFREVDVTTVSLIDVFEKYFGVKPNEYMSVDTEGSEYEILSSFNSTKYHPSVITVEENYTAAEARLDHLFSQNNYVRVFTPSTEFDAW